MKMHGSRIRGRRGLALVLALGMTLGGLGVTMACADESRSTPVVPDRTTTPRSSFVRPGFAAARNFGFLQPGFARAPLFRNFFGFGFNPFLFPDVDDFGFFGADLEFGD